MCKVEERMGDIGIRFISILLGLLGYAFLAVALISPIVFSHEAAGVFFPDRSLSDTGISGGLDRHSVSAGVSEKLAGI